MRARNTIKTNYNKNWLGVGFDKSYHTLLNRLLLSIKNKEIDTFNLKYEKNCFILQIEDEIVTIEVDEL